MSKDVHLARRYGIDLRNLRLFQMRGSSDVKQLSIGEVSVD